MILISRKSKCFIGFVNESRVAFKLAMNVFNVYLKLAEQEPSALIISLVKQGGHFFMPFRF